MMGSHAMPSKWSVEFRLAKATCSQHLLGECELARWWLGKLAAAASNTFACDRYMFLLLYVWLNLGCDDWWILFFAEMLFTYGDFGRKIACVHVPSFFWKIFYCNNRICTHTHSWHSRYWGSRKLYFLFTVMPIMTRWNLNPSGQYVGTELEQLFINI